MVHRASILTDRDDELATLATALADGGTVLVEEPAGSGTSALLDALRSATPAPRRVVSLTARPTEQLLPFELLRRVARDLVGDGGRPAAAVPAEALRTGGAPLDESLLVRLLDAGDAPVLLLVHDAHVTDADSLRGLVFLAHRARELGLALALGARPDGRGPAAPGLRALRACPDVQRLAPPPLTTAGVARTLAAAGLAGASGAFVTACATATGGRRAHLLALLDAVRRDGAPTDAAGAATLPTVAPRAIADALRLDLDGLGPAAAAIVDATVTLGPGAPIADVALLAGIATAAVSATAQVLEREGLLALHDGGLAVVPPVVAAAASAARSPLEAEHHHARAAALLLGAGRAEERVAEHLLRCAPAGDAQLAGVLAGAAERALAEGDADHAATLAARGRIEVDRQDRRVLHARAAAAAGRPEAPDLLRDAADRSTDPPERAALLLALGRTLLQAGRYVAARDAFADGTAAAPVDDRELHDALRAGWAAAAMWVSEGGAAVQADAAARTRDGSPRERIATAHDAAAALLEGRDRDAALAGARRAWADGALLDELGPDDATLYAVTAVLADGDALEEALAVATAIEAAADARAARHAAATAAYVRASVLMLCGDLADAATAASRAVTAERDGWGLYASAARWVAAMVAVRRGDRAAAEELVSASPGQEQRLAEGADYAALLLARGELALVDDEPDLALHHLRAARERAAALGVCIGCYNWRPVLVAAHAAAGDRDAARTLARENRALAERWGSPQAVGTALRAQALAEPERALELLPQAAAVLATSGDRSEQLRTDLLLARTAVAHGEPALARDRFSAALDLADRTGSVVAARDALTGLRQLGRRPRRARRTGPEALTTGELRVARLAADGRTNRAIAEQLQVTPKAVKWHLGNAYRKLGIAGRDELRAALGAAAAPPGA